MADWSGHVPKPENWQLQFPDGQIVIGEDFQSDYAKKDEAIEVARVLSEEWQTQIIVKQTS